jgi:hypothetical protein
MQVLIIFFILSKLTEYEAKSKQTEIENAELKENYTQLSKEKGILEKKCSTVSVYLNLNFGRM